MILAILESIQSVILGITNSPIVLGTCIGFTIVSGIIVMALTTAATLGPGFDEEDDELRQCECKCKCK